MNADTAVKDRSSTTASERPVIAHRRSTVNHLLWGAALIPFLAAVAAHALGRPPQSPLPRSERPPRPALVFDQYLVNLGAVPADRHVIARFRFRNNGQHTLRITDLEGSCGCLNPRLEKRTYGPEETGEFFLRVQSTNEEPGPKEYFVDMRYRETEGDLPRDVEPRSVRLTMKVILPEEKVVVRPKALIFYQLSPGETTQEVVITDYRGRTLEPTGVACNSPLARAEIAGTGHDAEGNREIRVRVTAAAEVPPGQHRALVEVGTDDPEHERLRIPLLIQGPARSADDGGQRLSSGGRDAGTGSRR